MRLPNGYGSVHKLSGNRRKPYRARVTVGWSDYKQIFKTIGCFETREDGIIALAEYHKNPYDIDNTVTFEEVYQGWSSKKFETITKSNINGYNASYAVCTNLYKIQFKNIRKNHLQGVIDTCRKNYPTLRKIKVLFNQLYKYALENDICQKDYSEFVDIVKHKQKIEEKHKPFTDFEIEKLWDNAHTNEYIKVILMLIYSGVRVSELLNLKKGNVHIREQYFDVVASKTENGIRKVPIADKVLPFYEEWYNKNDCKYLLSTIEGRQLRYYNYKDCYWNNLLKKFDMQHLPHDTRHTCISLLARAEVNQTIIKRIVGHSGAMSLTEKVYTHFDIQQLINAINLIQNLCIVCVLCVYCTQNLTHFHTVLQIEQNTKNLGNSLVSEVLQFLLYLKILSL